MTDNTITIPLHDADLVVFDWDGTLFDSTGLIAHSLVRAAQALDLGEVSMAQARQVIGLGLSEATHSLIGQVSAATLEQFVATYRTYYFSDEGTLVFFDGILPLLHALKAQGKYLAVATGKSHMGLMRLFDAHPEMKRLFDATRTADQTCSKPHPQMLHELLDELDVSAARAVMVGDTQYDIDMAHAAQMRSLAVSFGAHSVADLQAVRPTHLVHDVTEMSAQLLGAALGTVLDDVIDLKGNQK